MDGAYGLSIGAPGPEGAYQKEQWHQVLTLEGAMILSSTTVLLILIMSALIRRSGNRLLHGALTLLSAIYVPVITKAMDTYDYLAAPSPLLIVSGALLLIIFNKSKPNNVRLAKSKGDDDKNGQNKNDGLPLEDISNIGWFVFLLYGSYDYVISSKENHSVLKELSLPTGLLLVLSLFKVVHNKVASVAAAKSYRVGKNAEVVASYMEVLENGDHQLEGCPYLVMGEERQTLELTPKGYSFKIKSEKDVITVNKVWQCEGKLLKENERNQDVCLSFAMFKLLRLGLEENPLSKRNSESLNVDLRRFFTADPQRAFQIVEKELDFMDDYLHYPLSFTYFSWFAVSNIFLSLLFVTCCLYIGLQVLHRVIQHDSYIRHAYMNNDNLATEQRASLMYFDVTVCLLILLVTGFMEILEVASYIFSDHARVALLCKYVNQNKSARKVFEFLYPNLRIPKKLCPNKLRQHSLLKGKKESSVKLSNEVKEAVTVSLKNMIGHESSTGNISSLLVALHELGIPRELVAYKQEYGYVERIIVWHIATTCCEEKHTSKQPEHPNLVTKYWRCCKREARTQYLNSDHQVASTLSRYCTYLVVSTPELLPDTVAWTRSILKGIKKHIKQIALLKKSGVSPQQKVSNLKTQGPSERIGQELYHNGEELGKHLSKRITTDEEKTWKFLAAVWAEILLSVAPSDEVNAHAESIRKGGEFITDVWALLYNIGINDSRMVAGVLAPIDLEAVE